MHHPAHGQVHLTGQVLAYAGLCALTNLSCLQYLDIRNSKVDREGHRHLSELTALQGLQIAGEIEDWREVELSDDDSLDSYSVNDTLDGLSRLRLLTHLRVGQRR